MRQCLPEVVPRQSAKHVLALHGKQGCLEDVRRGTALHGSLSGQAARFCGAAARSSDVCSFHTESIDTSINTHAVQADGGGPRFNRYLAGSCNALEGAQDSRSKGGPFRQGAAYLEQSIILQVAHDEGLLKSLSGQVPASSAPAARVKLVQRKLDTAPDKDTLASEPLLAELACSSAEDVAVDHIKFLQVSPHTSIMQLMRRQK